MNDIRLNVESLSILTVPLVGVAAVLSFTVGPLARFAHPTLLAIGGIVFGIGIVVSYVTAVFEFPRFWWPTANMISGLGVTILVAVFHIAAADGYANDQRCLAIQQDMLSAKPRRADGPDLYQALGCRPQGEGSVYAPAQSARRS